MFYCIVGLGLLLTYKTAILHPEVKFFSGLKPKVRMQVKGKGLDFQLDLGSWLSEGAIASTAPIEEFVRAKCPFRCLVIVQQVSCPAARELEKRVRTKLEASGYPFLVQAEDASRARALAPEHRRGPLLGPRGPAHLPR